MRQSRATSRSSSSAIPDNGLEIHVCDEGRGMMPRQDSPGLGVGLPIVAKLAERFKVEARPTGGTAVRMFFAVPATPDGRRRLDCTDMSDYAIVDADEVEDVYAGSDVPGEFRRLTDALRLRAAGGHADPRAAALGLRAGDRPLPRRGRGALPRHARHADDALRRRRAPRRAPARPCASPRARRARTATRATSPSSCGPSRAASSARTRPRSTTSGPPPPTPRSIAMLMRDRSAW